MNKKSAGFSMLEILIALVISLVTLMGAAGLVVRTVQQEVEAVQRLQALTLAQDMIDRININRQVVACYSNGANGIEVGNGVQVNSIPSCSGGTVSQNDRADDDLEAWHNKLIGASEVTGSNANVGSMIDAHGCITQVNAVNRTYRVTVAWRGLSDTVEPAVACDSGSYAASERERRRAVSLLVQIGDLT